MAHTFHTEDDVAHCITCGAAYRDGREEFGARCTGRTDLEHFDPRESGHALTCTTFEQHHTCDHLAWTHGCDCDHCKA